MNIMKIINHTNYLELIKKKKKSRKNTLSVIGHTRRGATVFIKINYENYEKA